MVNQRYIINSSWSQDDIKKWINDQSDFYKLFQFTYQEYQNNSFYLAVMELR